MSKQKRRYKKQKVKIKEKEEKKDVKKSTYVHIMSELH